MSIAIYQYPGQLGPPGFRFGQAFMDPRQATHILTLTLTG